MASASWIWADAVHNDQTIFLRRRITLNSLPKSATLYITADDFFTLFVNGVQADRVPGRTRTTRTSGSTRIGWM